MRTVKRSIPKLLALLAASSLAHANTIIVPNTPTLVGVRVGSTTAVDLVTFTVPATNIGDGTPVPGSAPPAAGGGYCAANEVVVAAQGRALPANSRTITLTADSSIPLTSGTDTIPFTQIAWTSTGFPPVTIPSGTFTGAPGQVLTSFLNSRESRQCFAFRFLNTQVFGAGTYNGRVTFTASMP